MKKALVLLILTMTVLLCFVSCNQWGTQDQTPEHTHNFGEWSVTKNPTCTKGGVKTRYCDCGEEQSDTIPATGHEEQILSAKDATCTEKGLTEGKKCSVCDEILLAQQEIPVVAHTYDNSYDEECNVCGHNRDAECAHMETEVIKGYDATCTFTGLTDGSKCKKCDEILVSQTIIPVKGHTEVILPAVEATFSEDGLTEGKTCEVCNTILVSQITIPALGSDVVADADYFDGEELEINRYSYSLSVNENDEFTLTTLTISANLSYTLEYSTGKLNSVDSVVYELKFDDGRESMYIRFIDGNFEFCEKDGSAWDKHKYTRPDGETTVDIVPREGNSSYGYYDLANNSHGKDMQDLYYRLYYACEAFLSNELHVTNTNGLHVIDTINLKHYKITAEEAISVWKVFYVENPRYYWLANSVSIINGKLKLCIDEDYASPDYRKLCDNAIDKMVNECNKLINNNMSELEKSLEIHNFILNNMNYAYEYDGVTPEDNSWAHNMVGCAKYNLGVCESYAKTYLYLCLLNDLDCIIVTGMAGDESHAWNLISINDAWYGVDVTWDETNTDDISYSCFGMSKMYTESTHIADSPSSYGIEYLYETPDISERSIELVVLYENDKLVGVFENIDVAFDKMINDNSNYSISLQYYDYVGPLLLSSPNVVHNVYSSNTPKVKSLTIKGQHIDAGDGYNTRIPIYINEQILVCSNLVIDDVNLMGNGTINIGDFSVTVNSTYGCLIYNSIVGNTLEGSTSKIICDSRNTEFCGKIEVHDFIGTGTMRHSAKIVNIKLNSIDDLCINVNVYGGGNVEINNLYAEHGFAGVRIVHYSNVLIHNLYSSYKVSVVFEFGTIEEFAMLEIGNIYGEVDVHLCGEITYVTTDTSGNEIHRWTEKASPFNINREALTINNADDFERIKIYHDNYDYTYIYRVNEYGKVKPVEFINENGLLQYEGKLLGYVGKSNRILIPDSIHTISQNAFAGSDIESVYISKNVKTIEDYAFASCEKLLTVDFEDESQLETIGKHAFSHCPFKVFIFPTSVKIIGEGAFMNCTSLEKITIPSSVKNIYEHAFSQCGSLEFVYISDGVIEISAYAFAYSYSISAIIIPESISFIGQDAFVDCISLYNIYYIGSEEQWMNINKNNIGIDDVFVSYNYTLEK